jgi:ATP-dependent Lhr-like helicase
VSGFDRLSPALAVQIVNALGWTSLRPVQEQSIQTILDGKNCVILAPTAGGKTEAALFPLLSLMDSEDRAPTSVLYIAPIRALLNNQEARLQSLTALIGRRAFKWHGDVSDSARNRFVREPADVLAITPESLEAMLMSTRVPGKRLLSNVRAVVIDEVHAFAADDRGSHLMALLERVQRVCRHDIQRIGLSATVGDPESIVDWLGGSSERPRAVVHPGGSGLPPEVQLDYVGSLANAAHVIDKLYPGTRRLVFVDSRRRVEELGHLLQERGVDTFLSHSSLAVSERHAAERAFQERSNCVIVATSALELGIDVGDLDRVIQIDAPSTVSSFLQRMGRTGRRPGLRGNCTFLATSDEDVLQSAALLRLWSRGYVEPTSPNRRATHVLAHQILALGVQSFGIGLADWWGWVEGCSAFDEVTDPDRRELVEHMLQQEIIAEVDHRLILGPRGERLYGRTFRELYAVFQAPRVLRVMYARQEVGTVDAWFAQQDTDRTLAFVLAGRPWKVVGIDWRKGLCQVEPADAGAYPRWMGRPVLLSEVLCQAMREVLVGEDVDARWSKRAAGVLEEMRSSHEFLHDARAPLVGEPDRVRWWTFAGGRANNLLGALLKESLGDKVTSNNLCVTFAGEAARSDVSIRQAIAELPARLSWERAREMAPEAARGRVSKFQPCLPPRLETDLLARHLVDLEGAGRAVGAELVWVEVVAGSEAHRAEMDEPEPPQMPPESMLSWARPKNPVRYIDTTEALDRLCPKLVSAGAIGLDVETTLEDQELCLVQLGTAEETWLIDALAIEDLTPLAQVLASPRLLKIIHHASFERTVLGRRGMDIANVFDTLAASRQARGAKVQGGHRLAAVCQRELGVRLDKREQRSDWRRRPLTQQQLDYAALDVEVLLRLHGVFTGRTESGS